MSTSTRPSPAIGQHSWNAITRALLLGFVVFNGWLVLVSVTTGNPPPGSEQLFAWVTAVGVASYPLVRRDDGLGYALAILTGVLGIGFLALVASGIFGSLAPTHPVVGILFGPVAYIGVALVLIFASYTAWRNRGDRGEGEGAEVTTA